MYVCMYGGQKYQHKRQTYTVMALTNPTGCK